jgi:hypothetical protein
MIVLKSAEELAATVRRVAREQKSYRPETISDLHQAATLLEEIAEIESRAEVDREAALNVLEDPY